MRRARTILLGLGATGAALGLLVQCFSPQLPDCSYRCGPGTDGEAACPPEYECREDRYCHLVGSTGACPFSMDLSPPADLRPPADLQPPPFDSADGGDGGADMTGGS